MNTSNCTCLFGSGFGAYFNKLARVPSRVYALNGSQARTLQLQGQKVLEMLGAGREKSEREVRVGRNAAITSQLLCTGNIYSVRNSLYLSVVE